ncbi:MAG TPA: SAM-dependent methyltransferase [Acidimicrobiales bacterium]|nr:SAM-dependent methyltransferase [Acidimicrobiales bacterium]
MRLSSALARMHPPIDDPQAALEELRVTVDGAIATNPNSMVRRDACIVVRPRREPKGVQKLGHALDALGLDVEGSVAVDLGACTGGFTVALLDRRATQVFAVDIGFGQLLGSLQQDPRVVNLERTNVAQVTPELLGGTRPDLIVADVTRLSLRDLGAQVVANGLPKPGTSLVGLVKPMFELGVGELPEGEQLDEALALAVAGLAASGWKILGTMRSEVVGGRGAIEFFVHARWPETT